MVRTPPPLVLKILGIFIVCLDIGGPLEHDIGQEWSETMGRAGIRRQVAVLVRPEVSYPGIRPDRITTPWCVYYSSFELHPASSQQAFFTVHER